MPSGRTFTLGKEERICSRKLVEDIFAGGRSRSMAAFPLRMVFMETERGEGDPQAQILVSVPKRMLKRAVERNRVKRQVREAYRHNKGILLDKMAERADRKVCMAFIWLDNRLHPSDEVSLKVENLLRRVSEKI